MDIYLAIDDTQYSRCTTTADGWNWPVRNRATNEHEKWTGNLYMSCRINVMYAENVMGYSIHIGQSITYWRFWTSFISDDASSGWDRSTEASRSHSSWPVLSTWSKRIVYIEIVTLYEVNHFLSSIKYAGMARNSTVFHIDWGME